MDTDVIYCGDNLDVLSKYIPNECIDLIYIDPPFNTSRQYEVFWGEAQERRAFEDRFGDAMTYLDWMRPRIKELLRVLTSTGSFYYHCDRHASHYVKVELDRIFGFNNFVNEIVWVRTSGHSDSHRYNHSHDTILFYTKGPRFTFHPEYVPYDETYLKQFYTHKDPDGRIYRLSDLTAAGVRHGETGKTWRGVDVTSKGKHWQWSVDKLDELDRQGRIYWPPKGKMPAYKRYLDEMRGRSLTSVWADIPPVQAHSKERLGYPTQKPIALMERIINASSNIGDLVLDAFCGCGTTLEAAAKLKRKWIGVDFSPTACRVMAERLEKRLGLKAGVDLALKDMPKTTDQLRRMPPFEFQNWAVVALGGIPNKVKVGDYGIDGRLYLADMAKEGKAIMRISEKAAQGMFETLDKWYPIQVKQVDKVGRPDIDKFETAMRRDRRLKGYFVAFGFSGDATKEIQRAQTVEGLEITPITVEELLGYEKTALS